MANSKKNLPNNPRIRSQIHEDQLRRGIKPRKAADIKSDTGMSRLGKPVIGLFLFVVVGSAAFQILQVLMKAF